ncbi:hypothetical protein [Nonomuraea soli]|uniref:Uncharacterized protein n=1 Tax=Nonomuraea soli TaxID=1032476 RepID=A0A7W0CQQ7_9ACTN|nr:hypothetical protein [Nonomuraea soli]MBA2895609.1 hypothetical protein [Nonomuraea soli]
MVVIGFVLLVAGLVVGVLLALADPVMLSRINGEPAEGSSGRFINAPRVDTDAGAEAAQPAPLRLPQRQPLDTLDSTPKAA